jgi:hypothetical protein
MPPHRRRQPASGPAGSALRTPKILVVTKVGKSLIEHFAAQKQIGVFQLPHVLVATVLHDRTILIFGSPVTKSTEWVLDCPDLGQVKMLLRLGSEAPEILRYVPRAQFKVPRSSVQICDSECFRHSPDALERGVAKPRLDSRDVGPVQVGLFGEPFLRPCPRLAQSAHAPTERSGNRVPAATTHAAISQRTIRSVDGR